MLFGAIADDYTGASDLAGMLAEQGVRTVQTMGIPSRSVLSEVEGRFDAAVIALKSRSIEPNQAVEISLKALECLEHLKCRQIQFKYCSTFDSTERGNIGPVAAALLEALGERFTIAVPALPINGRTQYLGYLFVNDVLLSESSLRHHPLNPMTESNLVRHLQKQTDKHVGMIPWPVVRRGPMAIQETAVQLASEGIEIALVDALEDSDLEAIAQAFAGARLITGGSGLGMKLPGIWKHEGLLWAEKPKPVPLHRETPGVLILCGSCSRATLAQIEAFRGTGGLGIQVDVLEILDDAQAEAERIVRSIAPEMLAGRPALIYSSSAADDRARLLDQAARRGADAGMVPGHIEEFFALAACKGLSTGVRRMVVAGGETSGAVLDSIGVHAAEVIGTIDPGVPMLRSIGEPQVGLVLKSGNFGSTDFFVKAARSLQSL